MLYFYSPTAKDFTKTFKTETLPNDIEDNNENINASRKSSLPGNLPPIPMNKTRPRLQSNAKESQKSLENTKENSVQRSKSIDSQGQRLSQKSLTRSNTEVYNSSRSKNNSS